MVQETLLIPLWATVEIEQSAPIIHNPKSAETMTDFYYKFDKFSQAKSS